MRTIYKKGDYIRKASHELFKFTVYGGNVLYSPYDTVRSQSRSKEPGFFYINERKYPIDSQPVIISKKEADRLTKVWLDVDQNTVIQFSSSQKFEHIREDTGEEKISLKQKDIKPALYKYQMQNPNKKYNVYKCSVCGGIHLGKINYTEENGTES